MAQKKYVSFEKLSLYHEKEVARVAAEDAKILAAAKEHAEGLGVNYDAAGAAATAEQNAKDYADGKDEAIAAAKKAGDDAAAAAGVADGKAVAAQAAADKAQGEVDALELLVGTLPEGTTAKDVVDYVNIKTAGIATDAALGELQSQLSGVQEEVSTIKGDYLKAADKTELQGKIDAEAERAAGVEEGLAGRIKDVEDDYLKAADKTELQGNIDTLTGVVNTLRDGVDAEKVDGVKDLIDYVEEHGTEVTGMKEDIAKNAEDIAGVAGRMTTAEGKITAVEGAVATKAEQSALDEAVEALEGADAGQVERIEALEAKFADGEGSVADQIADAKQEAIDTAAGDATTKANTAESNAKSHADSLNTAMNARVEALEAIDHDHTNKAELDLIASGDKAKWDAATAKAHEHANKAELDLIATGDKAKWDAAEQNAKTYADGLNTAMDTRMVAVETWQSNMIEASEEDINGLFA